MTENAENVKVADSGLPNAGEQHANGNGQTKKPTRRRYDDDYDAGEDDDEYGARSSDGDTQRAPALEVHVDHSIEKAMKILKRKLIKEGLFKELKLRRYYEKPSERKKRKYKESMKKLRKEAARNKKNQQLFS